MYFFSRMNDSGSTTNMGLEKGINIIFMPLVETTLNVEKKIALCDMICSQERERERENYSLRSSAPSSHIIDRFHNVFK